MDEVQLCQELQSIFNLCTQARRLNIAGVLLAIERAELLGPILQPTLYRNALTSLDCTKRCAQAALRFQRAVNEIVSDPTYAHPGGNGS